MSEPKDKNACVICGEITEEKIYDGEDLRYCDCSKGPFCDSHWEKHYNACVKTRGEVKRFMKDVF